MADNIKIVGEILNIQEVSRYDDTDVRLLTSTSEILELKRVEISVIYLQTSS